MLNIPVNYYSGWLEHDSANAYLACLMQKIPWQEESIFMFGKMVKVPRLVCWMADQGYSYRYSGNTHKPSPWLNELKQIRDQLNAFLPNQKFNSVLCNLYRNGNEYVGWHQDNEPELGKNPTIASISLGASRKFSLRHKQSKQRVDILLEQGSLLMMHSECQSDWEHCLPKSLKCKEPRINLTFRTIVNA